MTENENHLREYIYIDNTEINSILAQFNQGLNLKQTTLNGKTEEAGKSHTNSGKGEMAAKAGLPLIAELNGNVSLGSKFNTSQNVSFLDQKSVETILSDYSVEVLEKDLTDQNILVTSDDAIPGDFVQIGGNFNITNFKSIKNSTDSDTIKKFLDFSSDQEALEAQSNKTLTKVERRELISSIRKNNNDSKKSIGAIIETLNLLGKYGSALFPNAILISNNKFVSYCELANFRMSEAQLNMLTNSPRKIKVLGIVEDIVENSDQYKNGNLPKINPSEVGSLNTMMQNIILSSFNLINDDALVIKPLAIYFVD